MTDNGTRLYSIYEKACTVAQAQCGQCDARRNYVCTYHEGWADGFEVALALFEKGVRP